MSHITKNKVEGLDNNKIDVKILKSALDLLKKEGVMDIEFVPAIRDFYGHPHSVRGIGVKIGQYDKYGMDIYVEKGQMFIQSDDMNPNIRKDSHFMKELTKAYTITALKDVLKNEGLFGKLNTKVIIHGDKRFAEYNLIAEGY